MTVGRNTPTFTPWATQVIERAKQVGFSLQDWQETYIQRLDAQIVRCRCGRPCWQTVCHPEQFCRWCDRPMRLRGQKRNSDRTDVAYGGRGYCVSHYQTINKYGDEDALEAELDEAVRLYWERRDFVRAGLDVKS